MSTYSRQRAISMASGGWRPWADPAPVRAHLRRLRDQGVSYQAIAEAAGLGVMTVHAIVNRRGRVTARTAAAILAVSDTDLHRARLDAGGTRLRLRALQVMGHGSARVARAIGAREHTIQKITRGDARTVSPQVRDAVARIYDAWWDKRAPERTRHERAAASAARRSAIRGNWCPGAGLDEDELDTPGYQPACGWRPARGTGVADDVSPVAPEEELEILRMSGDDQPTSAHRVDASSGRQAPHHTRRGKGHDRHETAAGKAGLGADRGRRAGPRDTGDHPAPTQRPPRLPQATANGRTATGTRAGSRSGGGAVNTTWEQRIELARATRLARAREFAAHRGMSRRAGEHLAAAVDAEPGLDLSLIDQFPPGMREAVAAILPRRPRPRPRARRPRPSGHRRPHGLAWPPPRGGALAGRGEERAHPRRRPSDESSGAAGR